MTASRRLLELAERGRAASASHRPPPKPKQIAAIEDPPQTSAPPCPRCDRALTRENTPFFVCEACERLFMRWARNAWESRKLPRIS